MATTLAFMSLLPGAFAADIPVIHEVDVVVVGGSGGAVAAAEAAAKAGASVFLAARRSYLGDDIAGTLTLWDNGDELPQGSLAKTVFGERHVVLPYTYTLTRDDGSDAADEAILRQLNDGVINNAAMYALTRPGGRIVTMDLQQMQPVKAVHLYQQNPSTAVNNKLVTFLLESSADGATWTTAAEYKVSDANVNAPEQLENGLWRYTLPLDGKPVRWLRATVRPNAALGRLTLMELVVETGNAVAKVNAVPRAEFWPLNVKKALDEALVNAGVKFMTGCYATELLLDESGSPAGVVIANRSGRQAIKAKVVVDATPYGSLARQAGAKFSAFRPGPVQVSTVVITDKPPVAEGLTVREVMHPRTVNIGLRWGVKPAGGQSAELEVRGYECTAVLPLQSFDPFALAELDHTMRDLVFTHGQQDIAEMVCMPPPFRLSGTKPLAVWPAGGLPAADAFRPKGAQGMYVLSAVADAAPAALPRLRTAAGLMDAGEAVGIAATQEAARRRMARQARVKPHAGAKAASYGEVRELLGGLLPNAVSATGRVPAGNAPLPVLGQCDVLVAGGGTSGASAAIAAARNGADTLLCEYHHDLGGTATVGVLGQYYYGNDVGFTAEINEPIGAMAANINQGKAEWFRRKLRAHGARVLTGAIVCGLTISGNRVTGAVVATPDGRRGVILAKTVVDATGNADLAAAGGEPTQFIGDAELAVQGASMNDRPLGSNTVNIDISFVDDTDAWDMSFFPLRTRTTLPYTSTWDQSQHVDSRERRRILGEYSVTAVDVLAERRFPDTVTQGLAPLDNHGQTTDPVLALYRAPAPNRESPGYAILKINFPYRMMLPKRLDNLLVTGLGFSAEHDAVAAMRMQRDLQNLGYAAGLASAMAVKGKTTPRALDIRALQGRLVEAKVLEPDVPEWNDSFPPPQAALEGALKTLRYGHKGLAVLAAAPDAAAPLLRKAHDEADELKAVYAASLAAIGDASGAQTLIDALKKAPEWDAGWQWSANGAYDKKHSTLDGYILMLGRLKAKEAFPAIMEKAALLTGKSEFSHFRATAMALEHIGDKRAAPELARMLALPTVAGHHIAAPGSSSSIGVKPYRGHSTGAGNDERRAVLRELAVARALYRLGDVDGQGEVVLRNYAADPRSAYARHALMVLDKR